MRCSGHRRHRIKTFPYFGIVVLYWNMWYRCSHLCINSSPHVNRTSVTLLQVLRYKILLLLFRPHCNLLQTPVQFTWQVNIMQSLFSKYWVHLTGYEPCALTHKLQVPDQIFVELLATLHVHRWRGSQVVVGPHEPNQYEYERDDCWSTTQDDWRSCWIMELVKNHELGWGSSYHLMLLLMVILETGKKLASQLQEAHKMKTKHKLLHVEFSANFPPDDIQR